MEEKNDQDPWKLHCDIALKTWCTPEVAEIILPSIDLMDRDGDKGICQNIDCIPRTNEYVTLFKQ